MKKLNSSLQQGRVLGNVKNNAFYYRLVLILLLTSVSLEGWGQTTWYTLASGKWTNPEVWTLDPAGAVPVNPSGLYPNLATDNIVVRTGITITIPDGLTPFDSPLEAKNNLNCGILTVNGDLDFGVSTGHQFTQIKGNGRMYFESNNFPTGSWTNFITEGQGGGTIVIRGAGFSVTSLPATVFDLEINDPVGSNVYVLNQNLTVGGNLNVLNGTLQLNGTGTTARNLTVNGNATVQTNGRLTTGTATGAVFHWMNVYGDFTNNGQVDFTNSNQYVEANNGAVKLKFLGSNHNNLVCNNTTDLYRLFIDKGTDQTYALAVNANATANFKLFAPVSGASTDATDGAAGWQRLPIVISNGTLKLESNILISRLGENKTGNTPNEFTIPSTAQLWINGATVTTSAATGSWNGVTVYGKLKMSAGSFTTPVNTNGVYYATDGTITPVVEVAGGNLSVTQIRPYNNSNKFQYIQSGGNVNFTGRANEYWSSAVFHLSSSTHIFEMSGGTMFFGIANTYNVTGLYTECAEGNFNVTGGDVIVTTPSTNDFKICSRAPLYNLTVNGSGSAYKIMATNIYGGDDAYHFGELTIVNNVSVANNGNLDGRVYNCSIGGDLSVGSGSSFTQTAGSTAKLVFNGAKNSILTNSNSSALTITDLVIDKEIFSPSTSFYTLSLAGSTGGITINDSLRIVRGKFDVVNYNINLKKNLEIVDGDLTSSGTGSIILSGTAQQTLKGAIGVEQNFGRLQLSNTSGVKLLSDINATSVVFNANVLFDLDIYNLQLETADYNGGTWSTSRMFKTSGKASDGGLSIKLTIDNGAAATLATFPVGTPTTYGPAVLKSFAGIQTTPTNGYLTIVPVNNFHPSTTDASKVLAYYWKTRVSGFTGLLNNKLRLEFTSTNDLKGWSVAFFNGSDWQLGAYKYKNGEKTLAFDFTADNGAYLKIIESEYTAGLDNGAGQIPIAGVKVYTSSTTQNWNESKWTDELGNVNVGPPAASSIVKIPAGSTVTISANTAVASQVQIDGILKVNSGTSGHVIPVIKGSGRLIYENNSSSWLPFNLISGSHADFCNSATAVFEYTGSGAGPRIIPVSANIPYYPNLVISGSAGTTQTTNSMNLVVKGDLVVESSTFLLDGNHGEYVTVGDDVIINGGTLTYESIGIRYMNIEGDIVFTGSGIFNATTGGAENTLSLKGNIQQGNGTINFGAGGRLLSVAFVGSANSLFTSNGNIADFYRLKINKEPGIVAQFNNDFNLWGPTNATNKALSLISGECYLNNSGIAIDLSTGGNAFRIPSGTTLRVNNGALVKVGGSASNTGIWLDGALIVDNGGKVYCNQGSGSYLDNYIEYSASGNASIWLGTNAELLVGSQLRRTTTSDQGVLSFTQSKASSLVALGSLSAPTNNRGVFELLNSSSFVQSEAGCNITLVRAQTAPSVPTLNFNPATSSIASGSTFTLGNASTPASQNYWVYAGQPLMDLTIGATNTPTVTVKTGSLTVNGNLTNGGVFNANGYDLTMGGNIVNNGTYTAGGNTTVFNGSGTQTISGTAINTVFYDLLKQNTNTLTLAGSTTVSVSNDLTLSAGTINTGNFNLNVGRNLVSNGVTLSSGLSKGIVFNGASLQQLSGAGTFARLTLDNANGVDVPTQGDPISFTESLNLDNGVLNIGRNLIVFDNDAVINAASGFSSARMVQTNLSFIDNGIRKTLPQGTWDALTPFTFTYPIGSAGKYTPVVLKLTQNGNSTGSIRVKAADERHISVIDEPGTLTIDETQNVLQYNWTMDATGISGFSGLAVMTCIDSDALVTAPFDTTQYITARIKLTNTDWNKFDESGFNGDSKTLTFTFSGTDDGGIDADYTAGIKSCIPDQVSAYISVENGPWTSSSTWATYNPTTQVSGSPGAGVPAGGPRGAIVYINNDVSMPSNFMAAYRTFINGVGILSTGSSWGHRLGDVYGNGRLVLQSGNLPSGVYDNFLSATGGTLEYSGVGNYSILSEVTSLNNLVLSGTGNRSLPNIGFTILGDLAINGANCLNPHNTNYAIKGDMVFASGSFDPGTATVTLNGTARQTISGTADFSSPNEFYNLVMNNATGVDIFNDIEVSNVLTLTSGIMNTGAGGSLTITNGLPAAFSGGSTTSYVDGPLRKQINNNSNFTFPVGDNSRYGKVYVATNGSSQGIWEAEYYNHNPGVDGFNPESLSGVGYVSHNEYWRVKAPVSGYSANLTMYWDASSGVSPDANFRVVRWSDLATDAWSSLAVGTPTGDATSGSVGLSANLSFGFNGSNNNHYLTFGSFVIPAYSWEGDNSSDWFTSGNWSGNIVPSAGSNITINNIGNSPVVGEGTLAQANIITMGSGASLTLSPGARMTVNGAINNTGASIVVQNTMEKPSSFMTYGALSAPISYQWVYPTGKFIYMGHSVEGNTYANYNSPANSLVYKVVSNAWVQMTNSVGFNANALDGYSVGFKTALGATATVMHTGTLRQGNYSVLLGANWYLIGNPYATYLDLSSNGFSIGADFKSVYVAQSGTGLVTFSTFNVATNVGANAGSRYIAPGQSFWVRNYTGTPTLSINSSARTHATGALKAASIVDDVLRLQVSKGSATDEGVLVFRDFGSDSFSGVYDSEKRFATGSAEMSLYTQKDNRKLVINALPDVLDGRTVPLFLSIGTANGGTFTLSATNLGEFMADVDVYLLDKTTGESTNLRDKSSYTFTSAAVSAQNRFELSFAPKVQVPEVPTEVGNTLGDGARITAIGLDNKAIVKVKDASFNGNVTIEVLDALGKLHGRTVSQTARTEVSAPSITQFYVVKVTYNNRVETFKIVSKMN